MSKFVAISFTLTLLAISTARAQTSGPQASSVPAGQRTLSGVIVTHKGEAVPGVSLSIRPAIGEGKAVSDASGAFRLSAPAGPLTLKVEGRNIVPRELAIGAAEIPDSLRIEIEYVIPPVHDSVVIEASALDPSIDRRNDTIYKNTLFSRDDQIFQTLDAGINAGQHEGGGKSVEIRRFGFNLDHGGVNGGLKVLVDDVQQNQGSQGHAQGYLGGLKSLTPELIQDVNILNGPFSAEYGDFSGLGVVHIRLKESLPDQVTARFQGGSFDTFRTFLAYSPNLKTGRSFLAYEGSRTDGPFQNPLRYKRDNVTSNYTRTLSDRRSLGFKFNAGRNDFFSSGQLPLDEVSAGRLDRFGFIDPTDGGRVRLGTTGIYYRKEWASGDNFKIDGFLGRSLFDLYSNFTFFLNDELNGDGLQQHDSRLQEGVNTQYLHPYQIFGQQALLTIGGNFHDNQISIGLYPRVGRMPIDEAFSPPALNATTKAHAHVTNVAGYAQQSLDLLRGRLHLDAGLRYDHFRFDVRDRIDPLASGVQGSSRVQPKANVAYTPSERWPVTVYFNYGRGISSQDARGVIQRPDSPPISTTDFYQIGTSHHVNRISMSTDLFLIDRSNEQVYVADEGTFEFKGPSRAYGFEIKTSMEVTRQLSFNGGLTQVMNAFYRGTSPRVYVDSGPHTVANAGLALAGWHGFSGSLQYRHIGNYRLDGEDPSIRAAGLDVMDLSLVKRVRPWMDFNFSIDNLTGKHYFETQNYFESRVRPGDPVVARIHATPGYPRTVSVGVTFHLFGK
ncbi:MAG TPA: TonB-dependent receptor [Blastocatellia bacterium]|nr:TonB-dependent receptor [Blastocatellia bacterium]